MNRRVFLQSTAMALVSPALFVSGKEENLQWIPFSQEVPEEKEFIIVVDPKHIRYGQYQKYYTIGYREGYRLVFTYNNKLYAKNHPHHMRSYIYDPYGNGEDTMERKYSVNDYSDAKLNLREVGPEYHNGSNPEYKKILTKIKVRNWRWLKVSDVVNHLKITSLGAFKIGTDIVRTSSNWSFEQMTVERVCNWGDSHMKGLKQYNNRENIRGCAKKNSMTDYSFLFGANLNYARKLYRTIRWVELPQLLEI